MLLSPGNIANGRLIRYLSILEATKLIAIEQSASKRLFDIPILNNEKVSLHQNNANKNQIAPIDGMSPKRGEVCITEPLPHITALNHFIKSI